MKISWLHRSGNKNLIIFFSGWSIEPSDMEFLNSENFDVVMLHGVRSNDIPEFNFCGYEHKIVVAFSFGVFLSAMLEKITLGANEKYAINGTLKPIDNNFGIRESIFQKTMEDLSPETLEMFRQNLFDDETSISRFSENSKNDDIEILKKELEFIHHCTKSCDVCNCDFDKVLISKNDKIISYKNQMRFWADKKTEIIDSGHFPFYVFSSWDEIVKQCRK